MRRHTYTHTHTWVRINVPHFFPLAVCVHSHHLFRASIWCLSLRFLPSSTFRSHAYLLLVQLSFQMWTHQMQDTLNSKKKGDVAFRHKDFRAAIECYTQVKTLTNCIQSFVITCVWFQNCCLPSATSFLVASICIPITVLFLGRGWIYGPVLVSYVAYRTCFCVSVFFISYAKKLKNCFCIVVSVSVIIRWLCVWKEKTNHQERLSQQLLCGSRW